MIKVTEMKKVKVTIEVTRILSKVVEFETYLDMDDTAGLEDRALEEVQGADLSDWDVYPFSDVIDINDFYEVK